MTLKVVLAYSGGLDTSVILAWLREETDAEVIAYTADVGQGAEAVEAKEKALATGAVEAVGRGPDPPICRRRRLPRTPRRGGLRGPLPARHIAGPADHHARDWCRTARSFGADAISHGATGKGNDQVRFELSVAALAPDLAVIAPWREWDLDGRSALIDYATRTRDPGAGHPGGSRIRRTPTSSTSPTKVGSSRTLGRRHPQDVPAHRRPHRCPGCSQRRWSSDSRMAARCRSMDAN